MGQESVSWCQTNLEMYHIEPYKNRVANRFWHAEVDPFAWRRAGQAQRSHDAEEGHPSFDLDT